MDCAVFAVTATADNAAVTVPLTLTVCEDARDEAHVMFAPVGLDPCAFILTVIVVVETAPEEGVNVNIAGEVVVLT